MLHDLYRSADGNSGRAASRLASNPFRSWTLRFHSAKAASRAGGPPLLQNRNKELRDPPASKFLFPPALRSRSPLGFTPAQEKLPAAYRFSAWSVRGKAQLRRQGSRRPACALPRKKSRPLMSSRRGRSVLPSSVPDRPGSLVAAAAQKRYAVTVFDKMRAGAAPCAHIPVRRF